MDLAKKIDHANHSAQSTEDDIKKLCDQVKKYGFNAAFVNSCWVNFAQNQLGDEAKVGTAISFPIGQDSTASKISAVIRAIGDGADEIDISTNVGWLKSGQFQKYLDELKEIVTAAKIENDSVVIKFIVEAIFLTDEELAKAAKLVLESKADFIKTTSGFGPRNAKVEFVEKIRQAVGNKIKIKAAGGIHSREEAEKYFQAGADRIGSSAGVAIITGEEPENTSE